jgi:hypothetical protein
MIFTIQKKRIQLKERWEQIKLKKLNTKCMPVKGIPEAIKEMNHSCQLFNTLIKSNKDIIKSFIPFTDNYALRQRCNKSLRIFERLLNEADVALKAGTPIRPDLSQVNGTRLKKTVSDTEIDKREPAYKILFFRKVKVEPGLFKVPEKNNIQDFRAQRCLGK